MVWSFASRYPGRIAAAALALLVAAGATAGVPYAFKLIIDKGFAAGAGNSHDIARWFEYLLLLVGVLAVASAARFYFVSWLGERTVADIRLAVHRNLLRLSPGFFEENRPAEITSRLTVDTTIIDQVVGTTVSVALRNLILGIGCIVILFALAPKLALFILLGALSGGRPDLRPRAASAGNLHSQPGPHRRRRHRHQRSPWRNEDRPGIQPAAPRSDALLRCRGAGVRDRQAPDASARGDDGHRHVPDLRRHHAGHLGRAPSRSPRAG